ncbi:MAG TPA: hypothetical protein PL070_08715, partial [Flavobacteriales bacterium]|nr:hypothetical protein [Flavobacteriales bacterium]
MRTLNGIVYLEVADLEKAGISYERIKSARRRGSKGWTFLNDPQDARRLLIKFDDLEPGIRAMVQVAHGPSVSDARLAQWCSRVCVQSADVAVLRSHTLPDGSSLPEEVVQRYALACAYYRLVCEVSVRDMRSWGYAGASEFYAAVQQGAKEAKLNLPTNTAALLRKAKAMAKEGPTSVISGKWGNQCARKIGVAQSAWLVAQYSLPTKPDTHKVTVRYNVHAMEMGWPTLTEQAIYAHLNAPAVAPLWYMGRHGERAFTNAFAHTMKLRGPAFRDALWCSDGTKLNYFYQGPGGMVAALSVYLVMDVYSEAVLGHSISTSENFKAQFVAAKAALKLSAHKPLQWLYDNQGGHKMRAQQDFFSRAAAMHFPAQPYNAKSKPIESLIGRMQKEVMRDRWYFTGQNITTKSLNSRPNTEFILAHKDRLPSMEQVMYAVREDIDRWNSLPHPKTGAPRL